MLPLKILCWNIEHFNGHGGKDRGTRRLREKRIQEVVEFIKDEDPDVFAISEVTGKDVYDYFTHYLPDYSFSITEGNQSQEIMTAYRKTLTGFVSQRNEFKRNNPYLRPASLVTIREDSTHVPILFTHLKSMPSPEGFGLRDAMIEKLYSLKKAIDKSARAMSAGSQEYGNFIIVGDMNTMGMDYYRSDHDIPGEKEIEVLEKRFKRRKMTRLQKSHDTTWYNGSGSSYPPSNLDHVFAANHLTFKKINPQGDLVHVAGWPEIDDVVEKDMWIDKFSDHAPLIFTLEAV